MKFSSIYWIAACLFFLGNGFALFGDGEAEVRPCIKERVPKNILCPTEEPCDCDLGGTRYIIKEEPIENYGADLGRPHKENEPVIYESDFTCGGFDITSSFGTFGSARVDNKDLRVMPGPHAECYREFNCKWYPTGLIWGYSYKEVRQPDGSIYREANWGSEVQKECWRSEEVTEAPFPGITKVPASWYDCYGEDADWGGE